MELAESPVNSRPAWPRRGT